jgi:hypothetical protein
MIYIIFYEIQIRLCNRNGLFVVTYELSLFVLFQLLRVTRLKDRVVAQAVSCRPVFLEARVRARATPFGFCGGQNGTALRFFPCQYYSISTSYLKSSLKQ